MTILTTHIENWSAWAPGIEDKQTWQLWAQDKAGIQNEPTVPPLPFLPTMFKRRFSQLSKMSLQVAHDCVGDHQNVPSIFASRFGELKNTSKLLHSLSIPDTLSPAMFSMSVHNTASGLFAISTKNQAPSTALSGGEFTFETAMIEAIGQLQNAKRVLVVIGEEKIPECYHAILPDPPPPFAVAFLLGQSDPIKLQIELQNHTPDPKYTPKNDHNTLTFLKWFLNQNQNPLTLKGNRFTTVWSLQRST